MFSRIILLAAFFSIFIVPVNAQTAGTFELVSIKFNGNTAFSRSELLNVIYSEESPFWGYKFLNSFSSLGKPALFLDISSLQLDLMALKNYYSSSGYFEAEFDYDYTVDTVSSDALLIFNITENTPFYFGSINYKGLEQLPEDVSYDIWSSRDFTPQGIYNQNLIKENIGTIMSRLVNSGYMLAQFDSSLVFIDTVNNVTDLDIFITTGSRYHVDGLVVEKRGAGEMYISDELIKELVDVKPNEYYSAEKLKQRQNRLFRTGLFSTLLVDGVMKDTTENSLPIKISGYVGNMNELSPEIVMNNERSTFNLGAGLNYTRKNFLGGARKLTLSAKASAWDFFRYNFFTIFESPANRDANFQGSIDLSLKLEQPYFLNSPIFGSIESYYKTNKDLEATEDLAGAKVVLDFEMPPYTFISLLKPYYNYESAEITVLDYVQEDMEFDFILNNRTHTVGTELGSSKTNDLFFATSGYNSSLIIEGAASNAVNDFSIQSDAETVLERVSGLSLYYKLLFTSAFYKSIGAGNSSAAAFKIKSGYIQTFKGGYEMIPMNKSFYSGGSNSIRGWRAKELRPANNYSFMDVNSVSSGETVRGGTFLIEASAELRHKFTNSLGAALFADAGNVWNNYHSFRFDQIAAAGGFGFRYYSPIAPFRLDFAFKLYDPSNGKTILDRAFFKELVFHFGIGEAF